MDGEEIIVPIRTRRDSVQSGISDTVAGALLLNKRYQETSSMAKGMTKIGSDQVKMEMKKVGAEFQKQRKSFAKSTPRNLPGNT